MNTITAPLIGNRYQLLDKLGEGGMGSVHRAIDRLTGQRVALKQVTAPSNQLIFGTMTKRGADFRLAIAHEFRTLASLHHPNIIRVLNYGFDDEQHPYFTMDLLENAQTISVYASSQSFPNQLRLLSELLQALAYLHRRGILHRDLKPSNVLVVEGQVKVLDFGLAANFGEEGRESGTLAYIAPETLAGQPASTASDLYAVGVMAYEIFAKQHPFNLDNVTELIQQIVEKAPDVASLDIIPTLKPLLVRLLAKDPKLRYQDAGEIFQAFEAATNQKLPYETAITRESFLQAAKFVGRDQEFEQLTDALSRARNGQGSAWLIGGESGIGKSRLLDELRTRALVEGARVLQGQAISEGGIPYLPWRDPIRQLCLETELSDIEAGVLKLIVPDIATLLQRPVPDVIDLDLFAAQERLVEVVDAAFSRLKQPTVVILEDIHWAGSESIAILKRLSIKLANSQTVVIGSYRSDERPDLPQILGNMQTINLGRLHKNEIRSLGVSMLGDGVGQQDSVINFLERESEGNIFFIVEIVRALAEQAGQLDRIGNTALPERILTGGVQKIVQSRLNKIPEGDRQILKFSAVMGRQINLKLLVAIVPDVDIQRWLSLCSDASVIDAPDGAWRFAHDKLRERLLSDLPEQERRSLHEQVALAIEQVYPQSPDQYSTLAYHWASAGQDLKSTKYAELAGEQALNNGAYQEALSFFKQVLTLQKSNPALAREQKARLLHHAGQAYGGLGLLVESQNYIEEALAMYNVAVPHTPLGNGLGVIREIIQRVLRRFWLHPDSLSEAQKAHLNEIAQAERQLAEISYLSNYRLPSLRATLCALNFAEQSGPSSVTVRSYSGLVIATSMFSMRSMAETYIVRARQIAQLLPQKTEMAYALLTASIHTVSYAEWSRAEPDLKEAINIFTEAHDSRDLAPSLSILANVYTYKGQFTRSMEVSKDLLTLAQEGLNLQQQAWSLSGQALVLLRQGHMEEAISLLDQAALMNKDNLTRHSQIITYGLLAACHLYAGNLDDAYRYASIAENIILTSTPTQYAAHEGCAATAEVLLWFWEHAQQFQPAPLKEIVYHSRKVCKALQAYGRSFPIARSNVWLLQGNLEWQDGHPARAYKAWGKSVMWARKHEMPYEQALAYTELGRHMKPENPDRGKYLQEASDLFVKLGASFKSNYIQSLLRKT